MSQESEIDIVNRFKQIKDDAECDDAAAAMLTLAEAIGSIDVTLQISDSGYPGTLGADIGSKIAEAINGITRGGALNVSHLGAFAYQPPKSQRAIKKQDAKKKR